MRSKMPVEPSGKKKKPIFSNGEKAGTALSAALFLFGLADWDVPLCFLTSAFLVYEAHVFFKESRGGNDWFLSNFLWGVSIALFFGSIVLAVY
ncbi:MAG: hypothetical protein K6C05_07850 [Anaerovibrio sp.]|uniref:hypothetical protein n=1 Tax=Anaerovibrio sp. TaxID=1872532 RepID=UPI0025DE8C28|nr:hypothetical protein [Anaerovibrio sp.]MCR5176753.1 hypothetical protein [Anaerovibrio sp.]